MVADAGQARPRVHLVIGTRPEAVKMAPLALALRRTGLLEPVIVTTGQHPSVAETLATFDVVPDVVLAAQRSSGEQSELVAKLLPQLDSLISLGSAAVVVQGDTTSALAGGLVAMWRRVPLVHLEAGLRTGRRGAPFPEELNRRLLGVLADLHLAPTARAVAALLREGVVADRVLLVGNTVVDAFMTVAAQTTPSPFQGGHAGGDALAALERLTAGGVSRLLLVTIHRRESWGAPLERVLRAVMQIVDTHPDVQCVLPAHANPAVRAQVDVVLGGHPRVVITGPLPYPILVRLLASATLVLTDSGGIQEEAPSVGVPVLVLRDVTERLEAVEAGWAKLIGTDTARIVGAATDILDIGFETPLTGNPFGDGRAAERSAQAIAWLLDRADRPTDFDPHHG